jgi:hypothetical protein
MLQHNVSLSERRWRMDDKEEEERRGNDIE